MPIEYPDDKPTAAHARQPGHSDIDIAIEINFDLIERRQSVRPIPVPEAIERNDEESWSTWNELRAEQDAQSASAAAVAKLRTLMRRKG